MSETKHLPWKIGRNSFQVYDTEGHHIADMHLPLLRTLDDEAVVVERARIILDSVNQHDQLKADRLALFEALETIRNHLMQWGEHTDTGI